MKLVRHGPPGRERPGIIDAQGNARDLNGVCEDFAPAFFANDGLARVRPVAIVATRDDPRQRLDHSNAGNCQRFSFALQRG